MNTGMPDDLGMVDLTDTVNELCDDIMQAIDDSELVPAAALCACMQVMFYHVHDEAGMTSLRDLFVQFETGWRADRAKRCDQFYPPHQGVLQ